MTSEHDRITQKYLRRYPNSKLTKSWAGRMVHIQTENGVWRINGKGYTYAHKQDAWVLSFEDAQKQVNHCGPEKQAAFIDATTRTVPDVPELVVVSHEVFYAPTLEWRKTSLPDYYRNNDNLVRDLVDKDQAAAVIAAKDAEIGRLTCPKYLEEKLIQIGVCDIEWQERALAAEAKITQIEEPIGYVSKSFFESLKIDRFHSIAAYVLRESSERYSEPLYAGPVASDADLRAENERLKAEKAAMRKAATDYCWQRYKGRDPMNLNSPAVYTSHEWQKIGEAMDEAVAAINPSEART